MKSFGRTGIRLVYPKLEDSPRDEYQGYLPTVFSLAIRGASALEIAEYLRQVATERIGLDSSIERELPVADKIRTLATSLLPEKH